MQVRPDIGNVGGMAETLRQMKALVPPHVYARVELRGLSKAEKQAMGKEPYLWLSKQRRCSVVQFDLPGNVNHILCVDGQRRLVWDNEEDYPVELNADSLRLCRGVRKRTKNVRVLVMVMVKQRDNKKQGEK